MLGVTSSLNKKHCAPARNMLHASAVFWYETNAYADAVPKPVHWRRGPIAHCVAACLIFADHNSCHNLVFDAAAVYVCTIEANTHSAACLQQRLHLQV